VHRLLQTPDSQIKYQWKSEATLLASYIQDISIPWIKKNARGAWQYDKSETRAALEAILTPCVHFAEYCVVYLNTFQQNREYEDMCRSAEAAKLLPALQDLLLALGLNEDNDWNLLSPAIRGKLSSLVKIMGAVAVLTLHHTPAEAAAAAPLLLRLDARTVLYSLGASKDLLPSEFMWKAMHYLAKWHAKVSLYTSSHAPASIQGHVELALVRKTRLHPAPATQSWTENDLAVAKLWIWSLLYPLRTAWEEIASTRAKDLYRGSDVMICPEHFESMMSVAHLLPPLNVSWLCQNMLLLPTIDHMQWKDPVRLSRLLTSVQIVTDEWRTAPALPLWVHRELEPLLEELSRYMDVYTGLHRIDMAAESQDGHLEEWEERNSKCRGEVLARVLAQ